MKNKFVFEQENEDVTSYPMMDLYYTFFKIFKQWVEDRFGLDVDNYPISYLMDKYTRQFLEEVAGQTFEDDSDVPNLDRWSIQKLIIDLVKKNKASIPSLRKQEKFTEKYKNQIPFFIKRMELPDFISVSIDEPKPYELMVMVSVVYDIEKVLRQEEIIKSPHTIVQKLKEYFKNYLGVQEGNPIHGDIEIKYQIDPVFKDFNDWGKNILNKKIKKKIKELDKKGIVRSIRFTPSLTKSELKMSFKSDTPYGERNALRNEVKTYLNDEGYKNIRVEVTY